MPMTSAPLAEPAQAFPPALTALEPATLDLLRRHNLLRALVEKEVVAQAVASVVVSDEELAQAAATYREHQGLKDDTAFQAFLQTSGLREADFERHLVLPIQGQRLAQERFGHKAEARFLTRKNQLGRVVYSLLRVRDRFLAQELYLRIAGGEANFADLAAQFAEGPERNTKGIVGPVPLTQAHPALAERLRTASPGQLLEPMGIAEWWLVVRLETLRSASFDDEMQKRMARELFEEWVDQEVALQLQPGETP